MAQVVWVGRKEAGVRGLRLEPCLQGTVTLMAYPESNGCFWTSGLSTHPGNDNTVHIHLLSQSGPCYLDPHSKLVRLNEKKFGLFGVWVGRFCFCGARGKPGSGVHAVQMCYY